MPAFKVIGVIGGMGPAATADFLARLVAGVAAARDTDHPRVLIDSNPHVPDRNAAARGDGPSPGAGLNAMAQALVAQGAQVLAMPCNAAHGWADACHVGVPFVSMIDAAVAEALVHRPRRIGVLAVGATLALDLYGCASPVPVIAGDLAVVQPAVNAIKAGDRSNAVRAALAGEAARLALSCDVIIAACTEVPLLLSQADVTVPLIDSTAALARATLAAAALPDMDTP
jgi:aspartate racemase